MSASETPIIHIEYCKSCKSHSWCTHHSSARYSQVYIKVSKAILKEYPKAVVKGNELPKNFVPIKISENKYFDASKNKYVFYPSIGAFQITFNGELLFSKKLTNTWPVLDDLLDQLSLRIHGKARERPADQEIVTEEQTIAMANQYLEQVDNRRTFQRNSQTKHSNFTLTDHFRQYEKSSAGGAKDFYAEIEKVKGKKTRNASLDLQKHKVTKIRKINNNAYIQEEQGKKEIIMKLDSIQEENFTDEFRRKSQKVEVVTMAQWNQDLDTLEKKFEKFEQKVVTIQKQSKKFETPPNFEDGSTLAKSRNRENQYVKSPIKSQRAAHEKLAERITEVNQSYKTFLLSKEKYKKMAKIEQYLQSSEQEKNKVLKKIYGLKKSNKRSIPAAIRRKLEKRRNHFRHSQDSGLHHTKVTVSSEESEGSSELSDKSYSSQSRQMPKGIPPKQKFKAQKSLPKANSSHFHKKHRQPTIAKMLKDNMRESSEEDSSEEEAFSLYAQKNKEISREMNKKAEKQRSINDKKPVQSCNNGGNNNNNILQEFRSVERKTMNGNSKDPSKTFQNKVSTHQFGNSREFKQNEVKNNKKRESRQMVLNREQKSSNKSTGKVKNFRTRKAEEHIVKRPQTTGVGANLKEKKQIPPPREISQSPKKQSRLIFEEKNHSPSKYIGKKTNKCRKSQEVSSEEEEFLMENKYAKELKEEMEQNAEKNESKAVAQSSEEYQEKVSGPFEGKLQIQIEKMDQVTDNQLQMSKQKFRATYDNLGQGKPVQIERRSQTNHEQARKTKIMKKSPSKNCVKDLKVEENKLESTVKKDGRAKKLQSKQKSPMKSQTSKITKKSNITSKPQKQEIKKKETKSKSPNKSNNKKKAEQIEKKTVSSRIRESSASEQLSEDQIVEKRKVSFEGFDEEELKKHDAAKYQKKSEKAQNQSVMLSKVSENYPSNRRSEDIQPNEFDESSEFSRSKTNRYKSQYLEQQSEQGLSLIAPRTNDRKAHKTSVLSSKRKFSYSITGKEDDLLSIKSGKSNVSQLKLNTPETVQKIYGERNLKTNRSKVSILKKKRTSKSQSAINYLSKKNKQENEHIISIDQENRSESRRSSQNPSRKSSSNLSSKRSRSMSHKPTMRYSKFKEQAKGQRDVSSGSYIESQKFSKVSGRNNEKSEKSKRKRKDLSQRTESVLLSGRGNRSKSKISPSKVFKGKKQDGLKRFKKSNSIANLSKKPKLNVKSKKFDSQKHINDRKKSRYSTNKKSVKDYSLIPNKNPISNVGSEKVPYKKNHKRGNMLSIGIQKDDVVQRSIQTEDEAMFSKSLHSNFKKSFHNSRNPLSEIKNKKSNSKMTFKTKNFNQSLREDFDQQSNSQQCDFQRALILKQIYGEQLQEEKEKYQQILSGEIQICIQQPEDEIAKASEFWLPISQLQELSNKPLFGKKSILADEVGFNKHNLTNFRKILKILTRRNQFLIIRLFENIKFSNLGFYGVWLCDHYNWKFVLVNEMIPVDENGNPFFCILQDQLWPMILEKALAVLLGGYQRLMETPTSQLFHLLTGSNFVNFRIREQYEKNQKFLKFVAESQKKNFIIHAEKHSGNLMEHYTSEKETSVFYILSQKVINEGEVLLKMREQHKEPFMIKMSKFACQFRTAEILQLRVNHNFVSLKLPETEKESRLVVCELKCEESVFGCITLSNKTPGNFKTYLYRQDDEDVLRLIGQAKQKNKTHLFFDCCFHQGKYFIFTECDTSGCTISYFGEGNPDLRLKESIKQDGLKNDYTEYVPVHKAPEKGKKEVMMPTLMSSPNGALGASRSDFMASRIVRKDNNQAIDQLRGHFVDFLVGASK